MKFGFSCRCGWPALSSLLLILVANGGCRQHAAPETPRACDCGAGAVGDTGASAPPEASRAVGSPATSEGSTESPRGVGGASRAPAAKDRVHATEATEPRKTPRSAEAPADSEVEVVDFDCFSEWEHKQGEGLRAQRGGGPHGAAWNWYGAALRCRLEVRSSCRGDGVVQLRVGKHHESARAVALGASGTAAVRSVSFSIAPAHWERELEASDVFPFETLAVVARLDAHCLVPPGVEAEPIHLLDGFVGRFSGGE